MCVISVIIFFFLIPTLTNTTLVSLYIPNSPLAHSIIKIACMCVCIYGNFLFFFFVSFPLPHRTIKLNPWHCCKFSPSSTRQSHFLKAGITPSNPS
uniref:G-protein coupled receptors family 1 profile domain-containing protein n=1 Tax=Octopus bimaculoides TaxID=37653 RepID=A0A0L8H9N5_OCTBM